MSVINQVLLDLDKRRASLAERGAVPSHVRALPDGERPTNWAWIGGGAAVAAIAAAAAWMLLAGSNANQANPPVVRSGAEAVIEKVVATSAGVTPKSDDDRADGPAPAFRLSFELSNLPEQAEPQRDAPAKRGASASLSSSRVIGRESEADGAPAARAGVRTERNATSDKSPDKPVAVAKSASGGATLSPGIQKEVRQPSQRELAENEYRKAVTSLHQGRLAEAQEGFEAALKLYPAYHGARQAIVGLLVDAKRNGDAERLLQDGIALAPAQIGFAMALARLQVERGDIVQAVATLRKSLDYAQGSPDYVAFLAALLQRQGRHDEAIEQFQTALRAKPTAGVWWLGLGISLQSAGRSADAQEAFRRARSTNNLTPELAAFADQRLKQLQ